nr:probable nuclear transport factor 2 [Cherax quadricarinatus]
MCRLPRVAPQKKAELSLMSFEGVQVQGAVQILEKIKNLSFTKIARAITTVDCQPTFDGGVLVNILGQLKVSNFLLCCFTV